nr:hypothetical protein [Tanacetum cinerariifolium]
MLNPEDITDPTTAMNMALALMAKAFKLNYSTPTNNNQRISSNPRNRQIAQPGMNIGQDKHMQMVGGNGENQFRQYAVQNVGNLNGYNDVQNVRNQVIQHAVRNPIIHNGVQGNPNGNGNLVAARTEGNATGHNGNQIRCYNCRGEEARIQLQAEEFDLMAVAAVLDEIEEVNANCILMANLQQASTSSTQTDKAHVYDSDGSAEVYNYENCYDDEIFNMFTKEEQYTELVEPISKSYQVPHNDNNVISEVTSVEQSRETVEQHPANVEETRALYDSLYENLANEVEKVNTVNRKLKETNAELTTKLARFKNQEKCFEISQENYDKLERCYQKSVYQEQCLSKKINTLHLSSANVSTSISIPNEEFSNATTPSVARKFLNEEAFKFVGDFKSLAKEADESLAKHKALELEIERLLSAVDDTHGTSTDTKFVKQSILGKPPLLGETHALSKPVTLNSIPTPQESKVVKNDKVIAPGMFRINPFKTSREEKHVPNTVRASARTKPITVSQPPVITKKVVNSDSNGLSSTGVDNTKTRRP